VKPLNPLESHILDYVDEAVENVFTSLSLSERNWLRVKEDDCDRNSLAGLMGILSELFD
jgi:hypothetical protein